MSFKTFDVMSQLRQVRPKFTSRSTYSMNGSCYIHTDDLTSRPYTIFTVADSDGLSIDTDVKLGSRILQIVADSFIHGDEQLYKSKFPVIDLKKKPTQMHGYFDNLMRLFEEGEKLPVINNQKLGNILFEIANLVTLKLPLYNEKIVNNITQKIISL